MDWGSIFSGSIQQGLGPTAVIYCIAAMGLNINFGYTGLLNFGQAGFMAVGGYFHCIAEKIAVPEKLALVGFNGTDMGQALPLPLTSVLSKRYELGLLAGRSALDLIAGRTVPRVVDVGFDLLRGGTT